MIVESIGVHQLLLLHKESGSTNKSSPRAANRDLVELRKAGNQYKAPERVNKSRSWHLQTRMFGAI